MKETDWAKWEATHAWEGQPSKKQEAAKVWDELESNSEMQGGLVMAGKGASSQQGGLNPGSPLKARLIHLEWWRRGWGGGGGRTEGF